MTDEVNIDNLIRDIPFKRAVKELLGWWELYRRDFPWRKSRDPYKILVAEILLHRTRAAQVVPIYQNMLERFPEIKSLAESDERELLELLHSVGLTWRIKLFHEAAVEIVNQYGGEIPDTFEQLVSLPGISQYIASAVRCFAFGYPDILLDTNTVRVTGRVFGLNINDSSRRSPKFRYILEQIIDQSHPREFNWALIDLAALICKSKHPNHQDCPIKLHCKLSLQDSEKVDLKE